MKKWYVYILRCMDNSLYTGITTDVKRRYKEHIMGKGAKYTRVKKPIKIEKIIECDSRSEATKLELKIKKMKKLEKEKLILG